MFRGMEFVTVGTSAAAFAPSANDWMAEIYILTSGNLEFEAKGSTIKDMGGNGVITMARGEIDFSVMNNVGREAGGKEDLGRGAMRGISGGSHGGGGKVGGKRVNGRRDLSQ